MNRTHLLLLGMILAFAAAVRTYGLSSLGYWTDELCTLSEADGHGLGFDALPVDQILPPLPVLTRLSDAAPAWTIPGMLAREDTHPPLYFLMVRAWESMFGDGEAAVRSLDVCFSLAAIALLFFAARPDVGPSVALWACLVMAVASPQVQFAQEARNYMPVVTFSLAALIALRGLTDRPTIPRAAALAACLLAMMLTHYYAATVAVALAVHVGLTLRGRPLAHATAAASTAAVAFLLLWGPSILSQLPVFRSGDMAWLTDAAPGHRGRALLALCRLPVRWIADVSAPATVVGGVMFLLLPWAFVRRAELRLWVIWLAVPTTFIAVGDLLHATTQLTLLRYTLFATPAAYVMIAAAVPRGRFRFVPPMVAVLAGIVALPAAYVPPWKIDFRSPAQTVARRLAPDDGLIVTGPDPVLDSITFAAFQHYLPRMPDAAVILTKPADAATLDRLRRCPQLWVLSMWSGRPISSLLPGFRTTESGQLPAFGEIALGRIITPASPR